MFVKKINYIHTIKLALLRSIMYLSCRLLKKVFIYLYMNSSPSICGEKSASTPVSSKARSFSADYLKYSIVNKAINEEIKAFEW